MASALVTHVSTTRSDATGNRSGTPGTASRIPTPTRARHGAEHLGPPHVGQEVGVVDGDGAGIPAVPQRLREVRRTISLRPTTSAVLRIRKLRLGLLQRVDPALKGMAGGRPL